MEMGLCILCDEPFTVEHQSAHKNIRMFVVDNDEDEIDHEEAVQHLNLPSAVTLPCDSTLPFSDPFSFDLPEKREEAESSHFPFSNPFSFEQAPTSVTPKTPIPCDSASFSYDLVTVLGDVLRKDLRSSNPKLESQNEELEEDPPEAATDAVADDLFGETNHHQTLDDYSLADLVPDIVGKQKDTFPPTMTSFDLFGDDVVSVAAVPVIHIRPFDPGPQLPIHVPYFHSSCRHHFSGFFAQFDPGIAQENGSIPEDIIRNVVSATEDGFLTLVRRSYGIKPLHPEEFTSCAATIGYPLHSRKTGLEVSILMNCADAFLALVSICNSAINNPVSTAKGLTSIQYPSFYSFTTLLPDLQVFDQLPKCQIDVWEAIASVCTNNGSEGVLFVLFKVMSTIGIKHDDHTFNSMLKVCSWELLNYRKHVHSVVNSFNTMHFNYGCVLDDYEGFDEAESAICNHVIYNAMNDGLVSMEIFEDALVMFRDMDRPCCCPTKASCELFLQGVFDILQLALNQVENYFLCIVDKLGSDSYMDETEKVIQGVSFGAHYNIFWSLSSAYAAHGYLRLGRMVADLLLERKYNIPLVYVLLSNICAAADLWEKANLANGRSMGIDVHNSLACELCIACQLSSPSLYATYHPLIKWSLLISQHIELVAVLHRKMINRGNVLVTKFMLKWRDLPPKHGTWKFAAHLDVLFSAHLLILLEHSTIAMVISIARIATAEPWLLIIRSTHSLLDLGLAKLWECTLEAITSMVVLVKGVNELQAPFLCRGFNWQLRQPRLIANVKAQQEERLYFLYMCKAENSLENSLCSFTSMEVQGHKLPCHDDWSVAQKQIFRGCEPLSRTWYLTKTVSMLVFYQVQNSATAQHSQGYMGIFHRKMIDRGRVRVPLVLIKWKALPPKHGT